MEIFIFRKLRDKQYLIATRIQLIQIMFSIYLYVQIISRIISYLSLMFDLEMI